MLTKVMRYVVCTFVQCTSENTGTFTSSVKFVDEKQFYSVHMCTKHEVRTYMYMY